MLRLAELRAVGLGEERRGDRECFALAFSANQLCPRHDVAPLI